jgi:hypothetical protein
MGSCVLSNTEREETLEHLLAFVVSVLICTVLVKGSIRFVDGYNYKNTWPAAFGWTAFFSIFGGGLGLLFGGFLGVISLVCWVMVLQRYYEIDFLKSFGVVVAQLVGTFGLTFGLSLVSGVFNAA